MTRYELDADVWTEALERVVQMVPSEICCTVLERLLAEARKDVPYLVVNFADLDVGPPLEPIHEAMAAMVQVLVRGITNNNSPENAARLLFRHQSLGQGSRYLSDYLDGLPGVSLDLRRIVKADN